MRKMLLGSIALVAAAVLAIAATATGARSHTAAAGTIPGCAPATLKLLKAGVLTVGADNPAYPPWFGGNEKKPWKELPALTGNVERQFVFDMHLGETILPFRLQEPWLAVLPWCAQLRRAGQFCSGGCQRSGRGFQAM